MLMVGSDDDISIKSYVTVKLLCAGQLVMQFQKQSRINW